MRRLADTKEFLDGPLDPNALAGNLRDLSLFNRRLGGAAVSWRALEPFLRQTPQRPLRLLDVGTGAGDIPRALLGYAARRSRSLEIVATDVRPEIVDVARSTARRGPFFEVKLAPADSIEEANGSFDIVHSSMVLHHLEPPTAVAALAEMARVAKQAVIVNDLDRTMGWHRLARLLVSVATRNPYTRHDAPLSVRRAYRPAELIQLAGHAGLVVHATYWTRPPYRYALVFRHA